MNALTRLTPYFLAIILPLLLFSWFVPKGVVQLDLWLLWLGAMVFLGLPVALLEFALAKRSGSNVWQGMQTLTREADAPTYWRSFSGLSVLFSLVLGVSLLARFSESLSTHELLASTQAPSYAISFVLTIIALILSPLKQKTLLVGLLLVAVASVWSALTTLTSGLDIAMTATSFGEWSLAVVMALFGVGLGTGLYWFLNNHAPAINQSTNQNSDKKSPIFNSVLPVWLAQTTFGAVAFVLASTPLTKTASLIGAVGVLLLASFLFAYGIGQFKARFGLMMGIGAGVVLTLVLSALPSTVLSYGLVVFGLLATLLLSAFAGFAMKASHLRKTLNFKSELRYNLWRVAVRWLVPLSVLSALVGWFVK